MLHLHGLWSENVFGRMAPCGPLNFCQIHSPTKALIKLPSQPTKFKQVAVNSSGLVLEARRRRAEWPDPQVKRS